MKRKAIGLCGLIIGLVFLTNSCVIGNKVKIKEVKVFWGDKTEIIEFLNSPRAQAERWLIQSLGE
jgi:hypothetical protein